MLNCENITFLVTMGFCWTTFDFQKIGLPRWDRWKNLILNSRVEKQRIEKR